MKAITTMKTKHLLNSFLFVGAIGLSTFLLFFVITVTWIGFDVKKMCRQAQLKYGQEIGCTDALITFLNDPSNSLRERNSAIWALGQLGDSKALPVLQSYYTGDIPNREPLDQTISQYELKKAINLASGGINITAIFWRYNLK